MTRTIQALVTVVLAAAMAFQAPAQDPGWKLIADAETLRRFMSGLELERRLPNAAANPTWYGRRT